MVKIKINDNNDNPTLLGIFKIQGYDERSMQIILKPDMPGDRITAECISSRLKGIDRNRNVFAAISSNSPTGKYGMGEVIQMYNTDISGAEFNLLFVEASKMEGQ